MFPIFNSIDKNLRLIASNMAWICVAGYFLFHMFSGARGAISWARLNREVEILEKELALLQEENAFWENKISLIRENNLDLDLLDEQARDILGMAEASDIVVILPRE
ncbi:MAG: septum formation initiator family protein [Holosporaceae bacterium]|jgi:cell division protein FtsB|nr:septum formation initiator family protein [Holosporaceae bacterium]